MPGTYSLIASSTVGAGGASSIDFNNVPSGYVDLVIKYSLRCTLSGGPFHFGDCAVRFNGDTSTNYNNLVMRSREGSVASFGSSTSTFIALYEASAADATANAFGTGQVYISKYASSDSKSVSTEGTSQSNDSTRVQFGSISGLWRSSSPVTSIKLYEQNGTNFVQNSSAYLYGIKNS